MPVMIIGADTDLGSRIAQRFLAQDREVRVFVTDQAEAERFRKDGAKVAIGDVTDDSHVAGACLNCFSVILVGAAARDDRPRAFADDQADVMAAWARAVDTAGVSRVIWVTDSEPPPVKVKEAFRVSPDDSAPEHVFDLDGARHPDQIG